MRTGQTVRSGVCLLAAAWFAATSAHGADLAVPGDYATIQAAIDAAAPGDTVLIDGGTYTESLSIVGKPITLQRDSTQLVQITGNGSAPSLTVTGPGALVTLVSLQFEDGVHGGVVATDATLDLQRTHFFQNQSPAAPGAAISMTGGSATLSGCHFSGNETTLVASTISAVGSVLEFDSCTFSSGSTPIGTTLIVDDGSVVLDRCAFRFNDGAVFSAFVARGTTDVTMTNTAFFENTEVASVSYGATVGVLDDATVQLTNCTFRDNDAMYTAGGDGTFISANSIVPAGSTGLFGPDLLVSAQYSLLEGGYPGPGNINGVANFNPGPTYGLMLASDSPGIDAGNTAFADPDAADWYGHSRVIDDMDVQDVAGGVDVGCSEYVPPLRYVNRTATGKNNGQTWADAYREVSFAIGESDLLTGSTVTEIWVAEGVYCPYAPSQNRDSSFVMRNDLALYGGFQGGEASKDEANPYWNRTRLSGEIDIGEPQNGSRHVVRAIDVDSTGILDGFWIEEGYASGPAVADRRGAALLIDGGAPQIRRCVIETNNGDGDGYAVYAANSDMLMDACRIESNGHLAHGGDAVRIEGGFPVVRNTAITGNQLAGDGAISIHGIDELTLSNVTVAGNRATDGVMAGLVINDSTVLMSNSLISTNVGVGGEQISQISQDGTASIEANACSVDGYFDGMFDYAVSCDATVPRFRLALGPDGVAATGDEDFRLLAGSCAIDSGHNDEASTDFGDALARARVIDDPGMPDVGDADGEIAVIDRGAFEFQYVSCRGDVVPDGIIGFEDLVRLLSQWGPCEAACTSDVDCTNSVGFEDLLLILTNWGPCSAG